MELVIGRNVGITDTETLEDVAEGEDGLEESSKGDEETNVDVVAEIKEEPVLEGVDAEIGGEEL